MNGIPASWRTAAMWVWGVGGVELALFGCCSGCLALAAIVPDEAFQGAPLPPGTTLPALRSAFVAIAVVQTALIVLPAIALVALGFGVRKGRDGARRAARLILIVQAAILSALIALNLIVAAANGQLFSALLQTSLAAGVVALQVVAIRALAPGLGGVGLPSPAAGDDDFDEPWNSHLPR